MATAYSNEVSIGSYNRIRIKCDYSGTSASLTIQFRRTSAYSTTWADSAATLTFNGQTKSAAYSYSGNVGSNWVDLRGAIGGYSISTSGGTYSWSFNQNAGGILGCSGTIVIGSQASAPSGLSVTLVSSTYNSVKVTGKVSNWGGNAQRLLMGLLNSSATSWSGNRKEIEYSGVSISVNEWANQTINNSSRCGTDGSSEACYTATGCAPYKIGVIAINVAGTTTYINPTVYYLPPAPISTLTLSKSASQTENKVTVTVKIKGANADGTGSGNATNSKVNVQYRHSEDNGSTWSSWTNVATNVAPNTEQSTTYTIAYGKASKVQARQLNYSDTSKVSDIKEVSVAATNAVAPSGLSVSVDSSTYNSVTLNTTLGSYGTPSSFATRYIEYGISNVNGDSVKKIKATAVTSASGTVNNETVTTGTDFEIKGCMPYKLVAYANNGLANISQLGQDILYTAPAPAITAFTDKFVFTDETFIVTASIRGGDNVDGATGTTTYKYKIGDGSWSEESTIESQPLSNVINVIINRVPENTTVTVSVKQSSNGIEGQEYTYTYNTGTSETMSKFYVPFEGHSRKSLSIYSTFGDTKTHRVAKVYASSNGVAKSVYRKYFED